MRENEPVLFLDPRNIKHERFATFVCLISNNHLAALFSSAEEAKTLANPKTTGELFKKLSDMAVELFPHLKDKVDLKLLKNLMSAAASYVGQ